MVDADTYAYEPASERPFPRGRVSGWMIGIGALVVLIASLLPWARIDVDLGAIGGASTSQVALGFETDDGRLFLGAGAVLVVFAAAIWSLASATGRRVIGGLAALVSIFMLYAAIVDISDDFPEGVSVGIGLWIVLVGTIVASVGSLWGLFAKGPEPEPMAPPPPPPAA